MPARKSALRRIVLLALPIGILIGLSLGALGGGGSILTVPALVYVLGVSPHSATTASLIIVGITAVAGAAAHLRAGRVRVRSGIVFGVLGAGGAFIGSRLSASIQPDALLVAFSALMAVVAVAMLRRRSGAVQAPKLPAAPVPAAPVPAAPVPAAPLPAATVPVATVRAATVPADVRPAVPAGLPASPAGAHRGGVAVRPRPAVRDSQVAAAPRRRAAASASPVRVAAAATVVGLVTGFFGVGGGFVVVPALVLALGFDMPAAVGTSLLVIAINSASSLLSRIGTPAALDPWLLLAFTAAAIVGTLAGSRIASKVRPERLGGAFALLMTAVAVYTAARSIPALA